MSTTRGRSVQVNQVVFDQADLFESDGSTRVPNLVPGDLTLQVFHSNLLQPWPLLDGTTVSDAQVKSGNVYWSEVVGSPGFYNLRWRPNAVGYWRLCLTYQGPPVQILAQDFDVVALVAAAAGGLKASFVKPNC